MYSRHLIRKSIARIACCLATIATFTSCSEDKPSGPTAAPQAVFEEQADCVTWPPFSSVPKPLKLQPWGITTPCAKYVFKVTLRDKLNVLLPNREVTVVWYDSDYPLYNVASYQPNVAYEYRPNAEHFTGSPRHIFKAMTNSSGVARFYINGGYDGPFPSGSGECQPGGFEYMNPQVKVYSCYTEDAFGNPTSPSTLVKRVALSAPDLNNSGAVNSADQSLYLKDQFCNQPPNPAVYQSRSDFDGNNLINSADLSLMLSFIFGGCGVESEE